MSRAALGLGLAVLLTTQAAAAPRTPAETVQWCASAIQLFHRTQGEETTFDAYVTKAGPPRVEVYGGTAQDRFRFEKCMADHGVALDKLRDLK